MVPRDGFITLAGCGIQKKRCPLSAPLLVGSRPTDGFQLAQFLLAEVEGTALPRKGHAPLKHKLVKLYRYLENDHLVFIGDPPYSQFWGHFSLSFPPEPSMQPALSGFWP